MLGSCQITAVFFVKCALIFDGVNSTLFFYGHGDIVRLLDGFL